MSTETRQYIKVYTDVYDRVPRKGEASAREAFFDLIRLCAYPQKRTANTYGQVIVLEPYQCLIPLSELQKMWKWKSKSRVSRFLKAREKDELLKVEKVGRLNQIKIDLTIVFQPKCNRSATDGATDKSTENQLLSLISDTISATERQLQSNLFSTTNIILLKELYNNIILYKEDKKRELKDKELSEFKKDFDKIKNKYKYSQKRKDNPFYETIKSFDNPELALDVWMKWIDYKKFARNERYKNRKSENVVFQGLKRKSNGNSLLAQLLVDRTIENNYQGIIELKGFKLQQAMKEIISSEKNKGIIVQIGRDNEIDNFNELYPANQFSKDTLKQWLSIKEMFTENQKKYYYDEFKVLKDLDYIPNDLRPAYSAVREIYRNYLKKKSKAA